MGWSPLAMGLVSGKLDDGGLPIIARSSLNKVFFLSYILNNYLLHLNLNTAFVNIIFLLFYKYKQILYFSKLIFKQNILALFSNQNC